MKHLISRPCALAALLFTVTLAVTPAKAHPGGLLPLLSSERVARLLVETPDGRRISELLIGRAPHTLEDLTALSTRLSRADTATVRLRRELRIRLTRADEELERIALSQGGRPRAARLLRVSRRMLGIDARAAREGRVRFTNRRPSPYRPLASSRSRFLETQAPERSHSFEVAVPVEAGSIEARLPADAKIYARLSEIEHRYLTKNTLASPNEIAARLRGGGGGRVTKKDVIDEMLFQRERLTGELYELASAYRDIDSQLSHAIRDSAKRIEVSQASRARYRQQRARLASSAYNPNKHARDLVSYVSMVPGELGELRTAVRLAGLRAVSVRLNSLGAHFGSGAEAARARRALAGLNRTHRKRLRKEVDLVLGRGRIWAEVKNYSEVVTLENQHVWRKVAAQADRTAELKSLIETRPEIAEAAGGPIELRIYFLGGISESAALELEARGFQVFGARP